jgi:hypothetical protein
MRRMRNFVQSVAIGGVAFLIWQSPGNAQTPTGQDGANRAAPEPSAVSMHTGFLPYTPMAPQERFHYYVRHMFSVESVVRDAAGSGILQLTDTPAEWGQGAAGYARRFGNAYAEHILQSTSMYGLSEVLHEDNRYFRSGETGVGPRMKYALLSSVMGRHYDGTRHFSFSRVASYLIAAGVSRAWQPPSTRGVSNFAGSFGVGLGTDAGFNLVREFFPRILHSRPPVTVAAGAAH